MHGAEEVGYEPSKEFEEETKEPRVDLELKDSTEFWLIHWPSNQAPDFDGKEVTLNRNHDGLLSTFVGSTGKEYAVVSFAAKNLMRQFSSPSHQRLKLVHLEFGKVARRVSFVHYPDPEEVKTQKLENKKVLNTKIKMVELNVQVLKPGLKPPHVDLCEIQPLPTVAGTSALSKIGNSGYKRRLVDILVSLLDPWIRLL